MSNLIQHGGDFPASEKFDGSMERCNICGRKLGANLYAVEVTNGGSVHDPATGPADINDSGYMGFYPVGSECTKKFGAGIAVKA